MPPGMAEGAPFALLACSPCRTSWACLKATAKTRTSTGALSAAGPCRTPTVHSTLTAAHPSMKSTAAHRKKQTNSLK